MVLRVAYVCADRGIAPGSTKGAAQHVRGIAAGLSTLGHEVMLYTARKPEGPLPVECRSLSCLAEIAKSGIDVVYERYSLGHRAGIDLARRIGARFVLEVNAPLVDEALAHRPGTVERGDRRVELDLMSEADLVIAVSSPLATWIRTRRRGPTVVIGNGYEPDWFDQPRQESSHADLVFLGHPKPWHGADRLPRLLADLADGGRHPHLLVIGGGSGVQPILSEAGHLGVGSQIVATGALPADQASGLLRAPSIGLAPYRRIDPFYFYPLKVVDYLAAGLAVVSTNQGDLPALVGAAGVLVDPDDDVALCEAVGALLDDIPRRCRLGNSGRSRAMNTMTWERVAARTVDAVMGIDPS